MNVRTVGQLTLIALVACAAGTLRAQAPEPNVSGVVKSAGGIPIAGMEVRIEGTQLSTRTDTRGGFAFVGAPLGAQDVVARGIGYMPARLSVRIPEHSLGLELVALATPPLLDSVKVTEHINVLSGIVVDERGQPVPGATLEIITGDRRKIISGEDGWFTVTSVREGTLVFRTTKEGYYMTNTAVRMNDWRGIVVHLETLPTKMSANARADASGMSNNASFAWRDASLRLSARGGRSVVLSEDELAPFGDLPLGQAISMTKSGAHLAIDLERYRSMICVVQDGRRAIGSTTLDTWRAGEVEMIELYPPGTESSGTAAKYLRGAGCRAIYEGNRTKGAFYAILWMK